MVDTPERIWAASVTENYGEWQTTTDGLPRPTEYVRADIYAALEAQLAERVKVKKLDGDDYEEIVNAAGIALRNASYGIRGQAITVHDSLDWWVMKETERRILSTLEATPPVPKVAEGVIDELRWITQNLPVDFVMHERCPVDTLMHVIGTLTAAQEAGNKPATPPPLRKPARSEPTSCRR